jgi:branched-chain amino acid transport system ATP-binding protein
MVNRNMADDVLRIENLSKSFAGNQVFNDISFAVPKGELSAIIGPNGAGKTTLFNLITGHLIPDKGRVIFKEKDISGMQPFDIVRLGMARAFQITNIFPRMSVLENVVATIITKDTGNLNMITAVSKLKAVKSLLSGERRTCGWAHRQSGTCADQKDWIWLWLAGTQLLFLTSPWLG